MKSFTHHSTFRLTLLVGALACLTTFADTSTDTTGYTSLNTNANQARSVLQANPDITVMFAPYDEFAKGVKIAVDEAGLTDQVDIYSADVSTADISAMREPGSAWVATVATNPAVVGEVSIRSLAIMLAGGDPGASVIVPPTLITQAFLNEQGIKNMADLGAKMPQFQHADVAMTDWMPLPAR